MYGPFAWWFLIASLVAGCLTEPDLSTVGADRRAAVLAEAAVEVVPLRTVWEAPEGATGAPRIEFGLRDAQGQVRPLPWGEPALAAVRWGARTAVVDVGRTLWVVDDEGGRVELSRAVAGRPAVDGEGRRLAWVVQRALGAEVLLLDGGQPRVVASGLAGAGALRFTPDGGHLLLVGAQPGGVAGLWVVDLEGAGPTCLTNCELRTGEPWGEGFLPPPRDPGDLLFDGGQVRWSVDGVEQGVPWRGGAR